MPATQHDLWSLVQDQHWIDPDELFAAIEQQAQEASLDYRTRLLIRDGLQTLSSTWGPSVLVSRMAQSGVSDRLGCILQEEFERVGFPSLKHRVVKPMDPQFFERIFRMVGDKLRDDVSIPIGGSVALILQGMLRRITEDIDIVDEVPAEIRKEHAFLHLLERDYKIQIAHFQRHYLPMRWESRTHWYGEFGCLTVSLVDAGDVFLSKLFSIREKDHLDMSLVLPQLDRAVILDRLKIDCASLLTNETYLQRATKNWYILTGDKSLPLN